MTYNTTMTRDTFDFIDTSKIYEDTPVFSKEFTDTHDIHLIEKKEVVEETADTKDDVVSKKKKSSKEKSKSPAKKSRTEVSDSESSSSDDESSDSD